MSKKRIFLLTGILAFIIAIIAFTIYKIMNDKETTQKGQSLILSSDVTSEHSITKNNMTDADYYKMGEQRKQIRTQNNTDVIASINGHEITVKNFLLNKLSSESVSGGKSVSTKQVFDKMVKIRVIFDDCQRLGITVTDKEALDAYDENYNALIQASSQTVSKSIVQTNSNIIVSVSDSDSENSAKVALRYFKEELRGLRMSQEEYRNSIGKETFHDALLLSKHSQAIVAQNHWSSEEYSKNYEQYLQKLIEKAKIQKTEKFPK